MNFEQKEKLVSLIEKYKNAYGALIVIGMCHMQGYLNKGDSKRRDEAEKELYSFIGELK